MSHKMTRIGFPYYVRTTKLHIYRLLLLNTIAHYTTLSICPKPRTFKAKEYVHLICAQILRRKLQRRECDTSDLEKNAC